MTAALIGCTLGPDYHRPDVATPAAWRTPAAGASDAVSAVDPTSPEVDAAGRNWAMAVPSHAPLQMDWWGAFGDSTLSDLEGRALSGNATLAAALAHYDQAQATLRSVTAEGLPEVDMGGGVSRARTAEDRPRTNYATATHHTVQNDIKLGPTLNYEVDLFGKIRRDVESATATAQQSQADLANARLVLTTDLANHYFMLRELDAELDVIARSLALQQQALRFVASQHELGAVSGLNLMQQQSQLDTTAVQQTLLQNQRAQYQNAIAALVGVPAPDFTIAPAAVADARFVIPLALPSELLQRRPDIASAERAMAAANAKIGVARAAFFPTLTLSPGIGWEATRFAGLFSAPDLMWTLGASIKQVLFDGGRRTATIDFANAGYRAAQANYRQTVLTAFQQVQDGVTGLATLDEAQQRAGKSVDDARRLLSLAQDRYEGGLVAYLDVIAAQQSLLTNERTATQIRAQRWTTTVGLVKALGGGWSAQELLAVAPAATPPQQLAASSR
ncbi:efflux transporter outer membrane subunit [Robbsia sp. KACC 23696]|uniref:efflux transporter outer membrane subunit n=1 Tax=Robbsia sp. KACC 23696 TaxID=3149231 RepID=UPI00325B8F5F